MDEPWVQGVVGKNGVGLSDVAPDFLDVGTLTGVGGFFSLVPYGNCFDDSSTEHEFSPQLHQAFIKPGKKGRAEANFWFHGETFEGDVRVLYVLKLFGDPDSAAGFPPADKVTLNMTSWELKVENEGKTIKAISCQREGDDDVTIKVTPL